MRRPNDIRPFRCGRTGPPLRRQGIQHAAIRPGSRSAPLVISFNKQEGINCLRVIDERSAGFFALGMAQQLHAPVALICTSGSAVLNYGPAVAEAFYQRIPLLVITADRPDEWVDQGEGQAIRQHGVLALHMKRSIQLPRDAKDDLSRWHCGRLINEAIDATLASRTRSGPSQYPIRRTALWDHHGCGRYAVHRASDDRAVHPARARTLVDPSDLVEPESDGARGTGCMERWNEDAVAPTGVVAAGHGTHRSDLQSG
ncbi:MAG: hypothetical protein IPI41_15705 [Flavobacteriales bacterium]|nr:hypothetical protein [Flavobacteriales bacterium]